MTAYELIRSALRLVGVYAAGEQLQVEDANDGLVVLQQMIDAWNVDRLAIYTTRSDDFPFVLNKQSYTLGTGGDFNIPRPAQIDAMSTILLYDPTNPIELPLSIFNVEEWQTQVPVKNVQGSIPLIVYDDGGFPFRTLSFWPVPNEPLNSVRIYSWQPLSQPAALSTVINFPPGYAKAFRFNLAVDLAAEYGREVPATVAAVAASSLAAIRSINMPDLTLRSDLLPDPSGYNYKADLFGIGL